MGEHIEQTMNIKGRFSYMGYIFELEFWDGRKHARACHPASEFIGTGPLATLTDTHRQLRATSAACRLLATYSAIYWQVQTNFACIRISASYSTSDTLHLLASKSTDLRSSATNVDVCRRSSPIADTPRLLPVFTGSRRQFLSVFVSDVLQKVRWCGGGIRLLAMQETEGQLLAQKQGSRAAFFSPSGEVRA